MTRLLLLMLAWSAPPASGDPAIPPEKLVYCTVCHGVQLKGNHVIAAPRLSGMEAWYVERQLHAFRNGWRGKHEGDLAGMEMQPMAAILSDEEIEQAAAYVSAAESAAPPPSTSGDPARGESLYATCAACHGAEATGNESLGGPALSGLNDWYLVTQLENFREGVRGADPGDTRGAQMRAAADVLQHDNDIQDVVAYITSLHSQ